jgi:hypothetical protein
VVTSVDVINECLVENGDKSFKSLWEEKTSPAELGQGETASVPGRVCLRIGKQIHELFDNLIGEILRKSLGDSAEPFGSGPSDHVIFIL